MQNTQMPQMKVYTDILSWETPGPFNISLMQIIILISHNNILACWKDYVTNLGW